MPAEEEKQKRQQEQSKITIANACVLVREALRATMPVAPEQYMTISIPGTVIDTRDIADGGTYVYNPEKIPFIPTQVRQAEAKLVDGMMPLSNVMLGNTGKSVARSYSTALDFLVARKATIGTKNQIRSPGEKSYDSAMSTLTQKNANGKTPVDTYIEKQTAWTLAQDAWDNAKIEARRQAEADHTGPSGEKDNAAIVQQYNDWNQAHYRRFKNEVHARFMDWVTNGDKHTVENLFGVVDVDSIMARIEQSKQSFRNNQVVDGDGADELQLVSLEPKNWAILCRQKVDDFYNKRHGRHYSVDQVVAEINRLARLQMTLEALQLAIKENRYPARASPADPPQAPNPPANTMEQTNQELKDAYTALYTAQGRLNSVTSDDGLDALKQDVTARQNALNQALETYAKNADAWVKYKLSTSGVEWLPGVIDTVKSQIQLLQKLQTDLSGSSSFNIAPITSANSESTDGAQGSSNEVAVLGAELANPIFNLQPTQDTPAQPSTASGKGDVWTHISASHSATDQKSTTTRSSWGMNVNASAGWGLWSVGGSYGHTESDSDFKSAMSSVNVSVSFSALLVNIRRSWLYAELFNDFELDTANDALLSPGAEELQKLIAKQGEDSSVLKTLAQYNTFPAFPTSFIVAADVVLEFTGKTQAIERHFHSETNTGSVSFGWGPFSVGGSFTQSSSREDFHMETTATGVRISFAAPQIIAWVSQILPALPRQSGMEPMIQGYSA